MRSWSAQQWLGLLQIWYAANLLGLCTDNSVLAFVYVGLALVLLVAQKRWYPRWAFVYGGMLPFAVWWFLAPAGDRFFGFSVWIFHIPAWYLLWIACLQLAWLPQPGELRWVRWNALAACALAGMPAVDRFAYWCAPQILLALLSLRLELRDTHKAPFTGRGLFRLAGAWLVLALAVGLGVWLYQAQKDALRQWFWRRGTGYESANRAKGFDPVSQLGAVQGEWDVGADGDVAFRLRASRGADYLRLLSYDRYRKGLWLISEPSRFWYSQRNVVEYSVFVATASDLGGPAVGSLSAAIRLDGYLPWMASLPGLGLKADSVRVGPGWWRQQGDEKRFLLFGGHGVDTMRSSHDLDVPVHLRTPLQRLWREASEYAQSSPDSVGSVVRKLPGFFQARFRYDLRAQGWSRKADPVEVFLQERSGWCEHFATATVLLLRSKGIPARYAKGFAFPESAGDGLWLYRRLGAHAWAEAWSADSGWQVVETTPSDFRPRWNGASLLGDWGERLASFGDGVSLWFSNGQWRVSSDAVGEWLRSLPARPLVRYGLSLLLLGLATGAVWRRVRNRKHRLGRWAQEIADLEVLYAKAGFPRQAWETVGEWVARLPMPRNAEEEGYRRRLEEYQKGRWR